MDTSQHSKGYSSSSLSERELIESLTSLNLRITSSEKTLLSLRESKHEIAKVLQNQEHRLTCIQLDLERYAEAFDKYMKKQDEQNELLTKAITNLNRYLWSAVGGGAVLVPVLYFILENYVFV